MSNSLLNRTTINGAFSRKFNMGRIMNGVEPLAVKANVVGETVTFGTVDRAPPAQKFQGVRRFAKLTSRRLNITNEQWESSVSMRKIDVERDQTGQLVGKATELADRLTSLQHSIVSTLLTSNGTTTLDGVAMFSASHTIGKSGTQSNLLTSSDIGALDIASSASPIKIATPEEAAAIINGITGKFLAYLDEWGEPLHMDLQSILFMVHPVQLGAFAMAVRSNNLLASGATNPITGLTQEGISYRAVANPRISTGEQIHAFRVDHPTVKPFIYNEEKPVTLSYLDENSEHCIKTGEMSISGDWQGGWNYGDPMFAIRATMS